MTNWKAVRVRCQHCGKDCAGSLRGHPGDGTEYFPRRHKFNGETCPGIFRLGLNIGSFKKNFHGDGTTSFELIKTEK